MIQKNPKITQFCENNQEKHYLNLRLADAQVDVAFSQSEQKNNQPRFISTINQQIKNIDILPFQVEKKMEIQKDNKNNEQLEFEQIIKYNNTDYKIKQFFSLHSLSEAAKKVCQKYYENEKTQTSVQNQNFAIFSNLPVQINQFKNLNTTQNYCPNIQISFNLDQNFKNNSFTFTLTVCKNQFVYKTGYSVELNINQEKQQNTCNLEKKWVHEQEEINSEEYKNDDCQYQSKQCEGESQIYEEQKEFLQDLQEQIEDSQESSDPQIQKITKKICKNKKNSKKNYRKYSKYSDDEDYLSDETVKIHNCNKKKSPKKSSTGKGDKKNVVKNFIKAFRGFVNCDNNANIIKSQYGFSDNEQINQFRKDWKSFESGKKYNNLLVTNLIKQNYFQKAFTYFLQERALNWLNESNVIDKVSHRDVLSNYIKAVQNPSQISQLIILKSRN